MWIFKLISYTFLISYISSILQLFPMKPITLLHVYIVHHEKRELFKNYSLADGNCLIILQCFVWMLAASTELPC